MKKKILVNSMVHGWFMVDITIVNVNGVDTTMVCGGYNYSGL